MTPRMLSVVMPVRDAAAVVGDQLEALAGQTYQGAWELVVADNGSTDGSLAVVERWRDRLPALRIVDASEARGAAGARNLAAAQAAGNAIAFCDADDVVAPGWLAALARALEHHDLVAGACEHERLNPHGTAGWHGRPFETELPVAMGFKPFATSANMAVWRSALLAVGGFDERFGHLGAAGEDIDLSWRLQLAGHQLHYKPDALVFYRHRHRLRGVWRQYVGYGMADAMLYRRYRAWGARPRPLRLVARRYRGLVLRLPGLARREARGRWTRDAAHHWGCLRGSIKVRVMFL